MTVFVRDNDDKVMRFLSTPFFFMVRRAPTSVSLSLLGDKSFFFFFFVDVGAGTDGIKVDIDIACAVIVDDDAVSLVDCGRYA